jgi:hypothetical protein
MEMPALYAGVRGVLRDLRHKVKAGLPIYEKNLAVDSF